MTAVCLVVTGSSSRLGQLLQNGRLLLHGARRGPQRRLDVVVASGEEGLRGVRMPGVADLVHGVAGGHRLHAAATPG
jgi:hypothetical protein